MLCVCVCACTRVYACKVPLCVSLYLCVLIACVHMHGRACVSNSLSTRVRMHVWACMCTSMHSLVPFTKMYVGIFISRIWWSFGPPILCSMRYVRQRCVSQGLFALVNTVQLWSGNINLSWILAGSVFISYVTWNTKQMRIITSNVYIRGNKEVTIISLCLMNCRATTR